MTQSDRPIILCGLGRVGARVLDYLAATGWPVVVIDLRPPDDPLPAGVRLVVGDFRRREVLDQAGVATARGVLMVTSDDLVNISGALLVRSLNPDVRIVVRMFNQNLLARLGKAVSNVAALSVSALTAPFLALTALTGELLGTFPLGDRRQHVAEVTVDDGSPLKGLRVVEAARRHTIVPLAYLPPDGPAQLLLGVDSDAPLREGDRLVVSGGPNDLVPLLAREEGDFLPRLLWAGRLRRWGRIASRTLADMDTAFVICTLVLLIVVVVSTLVYVHAMGYSTADGLYRTVSVIATGADMHGDRLTGWQKVFVSALRLLGMALIAAFTAVGTNYLLRARLGGVFDLRRIPDSGHVVVCGLGGIGFRVVEELVRLDERVVVIESDADNRFLGTCRRLGAAVVMGDATIMEVMRQARAGTARAVVAATNKELANLEVALLARELNPRQRVVVRFIDPQLAETLKRAAEIRFALAVPTLAAPAFLAALFGDRVLCLFLAAGQQLAVVELTVQPDDPVLLGRSPFALGVDYGLLPIELAAAVGNPPAGYRLAAGDRLTAAATLRDLERLVRREPVPADWAVEVTDFPPPAGEPLALLARTGLGLDAEAAERLLAQTPFDLAVGQTRGQAEELLTLLQRERVTAHLRRMSNDPPTPEDPSCPSTS